MSLLAKNSSWRPYFVLAFGLLAVSSASTMIRFALQDGASALVIAAWRVGLAALILTVIIVARYRDAIARLNRRQIGLALFAGLLLGIHFATWITSLEYTSVISSVVLVTTNPLWVALAAPFLLNERLSRVTLAGIVVAFIGGILVSAAGNAPAAPHPNPLLGNVLSVIGALTFAGYIIIGRRQRSYISLIPYIWLTYGSAAIFLCLTVLVARLPLTGFNPDAYFWMTMLALFPQLLGHSSYNYALGYLPAAYIGLTTLGEPVVSTILAALFLGEKPIPMQLFGGGLILLALVIASREEARATRRVQQQAVVSPG